MDVTIKDVAKEANVSPSTVSRVISGSPRISDETKQKVHDAIKKLDYHPNAIARSLVSKSTRVFGIVLPNEAETLFKNPFFIQVLAGISSYVQTFGYYVTYTFCKKEEEELAAVKKYIATRLVDGIILTVARCDDRCIEYLQEIGFPFVVIGRPENTQNVFWVDNDNFQAMYSVTSKLLLRGHRKVAFIGADAQRNLSVDRLSGYRQAFKIHGLDICEEVIIQMESFSEEMGYKAMEQIWSQQLVSAVIAGDDLLAFGANWFLNERGIKGVAMVGFNNTPLAEYQKPPLSSVDINATKLGRYAAKLLIDRLEDDIQERYYIVDTSLVERESTAAISQSI